MVRFAITFLLLTIALVSLGASHCRSRHHATDDVEVLQSTGTYWPGMVLFNKHNQPEIHIPAKRKPSDAVPALVWYLKNSEDQGIRRSAANWLGAIKFDAKEGLPALKGALNDSSPEVRQAAGDAIKKIETARAK